MSKQKPKLKVVDSDKAPDGRRQRSQRSRQKILEAMWALMLEGDMDPSAAEIAEEAGVGLRSVFRHFEDMDAIHRELVLVAEADIAPDLMKPFQSSDWKSQILELVERTANLWDRVLVPHATVQVRRHKSEIMMDEHKRARLRELSSIKAVLPKDLTDYDKVLLSLDATLCYSNVRRLREDRGLSLDDTKAVMTHMVEALINDI